MAAMADYPRGLIRRPRTGSVVERPRLTKVSPVGHLSVITGPMGTGKSVLAGQLADAAGGEHRQIWTRFAPGWGRASDLLGMVRSAVGQAADPVADDNPDLLVAADELLAILEASPTVLVVEDLHEAEGDDAERLLAEVGGFLPADSAVVVTSRRRPAKLIGQLDVSLVRVLDEVDLAFGEDEVASLLTSRGLAPETAANALAATGGWAAAVAAGADAGGDRRFDEAISHAFSAERLGSLLPLAQACAVLPYVTSEIARSLDVGGSDDLRRLGEESSLVAESDGTWRLHPSASGVLTAPLEASTIAAWRAATAAVVVSDDVPTAVELLVLAGEAEAAGDVLASHASEIGAARATRWLYQLPADVRRRLPPVLSGGRATVNVSLALGSARHQLETAANDRERREAQLGLGSLLMAEGDLGEAAAALEAAMRLSEPGSIAHARASEQLAHARWFAGDLGGTRAAVAGSPGDAWASWLRGVLALLDGDLAAAGAAAESARNSADGENITVAPGASLLAAISLTEDGPDGALADAQAAYEVGVAVGGRDLAAAGLVHAAVLVRLGRLDEARLVAEQIQRTIGRHDRSARLRSALITRACSRRDAGSGDVDRDERRVIELRSNGFAGLEDYFSLMCGDEEIESGPGGLELRLLGAFELCVDGVTLERDAWKSKKAREVCAYLAHADHRGVTREQVIEAIWPDRDPEKGRTLLRTALSEIRRVLEPKRDAGQESRFVETTGDRVLVHGVSDLVQAEQEIGQHNDAAAFARLVEGLAVDVPDNDWAHDLGGLVDRLTVETATRLTSDDESDHPLMLLTNAYEALITREDWNRAHYDDLASLYRSSDDETAAAAVERRWFADD